jgi:hypothetical protein
LSIKRFLMSLARVIKDSSTLMEFFALVSINFKPYSSAKAFPLAVSMTFMVC